jgi:hypothetical protein
LTDEGRGKDWRPSEAEIASIRAASPEDVLRYSVRRIADIGGAWCALEDGCHILYDYLDRKLLSLWPSIAYAEKFYEGGPPDVLVFADFDELERSSFGGDLNNYACLCPDESGRGPIVPIQKLRELLAFELSTRGVVVDDDVHVDENNIGRIMGRLAMGKNPF